MMSRDNPKYVHARKMLVQDAMDEFINKKNFRDFSRSAFCAIAKFGLQLDAKQENLFSSEDWSDQKRREDLIRRIEISKEIGPKFGKGSNLMCKKI